MLMEKELRYLDMALSAHRRGRSPDFSAAPRSPTRSTSCARSSARSTASSSAAAWPTRSCAPRATTPARRSSRRTRSSSRASSSTRGATSSCCPVDHVVASAFAADAERRRCFPPRGDARRLDGARHRPGHDPQAYRDTVTRLEDGSLERAHGCFRDGALRPKGTLEPSREAVASSEATSVVGGGDSVAAVHKAGCRRSDHPHLHRRWRVARVSRGRQASRSRGIDRCRYVDRSSPPTGR